MPLRQLAETGERTAPGDLEAGIISPPSHMQDEIHFGFSPKLFEGS